MAECRVVSAASCRPETLLGNGSPNVTDFGNLYYIFESQFDTINEDNSVFGDIGNSGPLNVFSKGKILEAYQQRLDDVLTTGPNK